MRFRDAGGDRADADFRNELHADARVVIRVLQVVNQLGQIFDRINVVMRRRRNQADAGRRMTDLGNPGINFFCRAIGRLRRAWRLAPF